MDPRLAKPSNFQVEAMTPRELDVLRLLAENLTDREIAQRLTLALSSVKWYARQIYAKLAVENRREAVLKAGELGLLESRAKTSLQAHNLPRQLTRFIGREKEILQVVEMVWKYPLITLTGPGGVGKTRLCLRVAEEICSEFPDGVWFVELAASSDPGLVPLYVATALGLHEVPGQTLLDTLIVFLKEKHLLLVLDNCEHLINACASLAGNLLGACPRLKILASSREALGVSGEAPFRVPSLTFPDPRALPDWQTLPDYEAISLFCERGRVVSPAYQLSAHNSPAVAVICQRLDGIPLAIELAAARLNLLSPEQLAARLQDAFRLLTQGARTTLPRQQTLRATIDWSFQLLSQGERILLRRLAVFSGSFLLEAVEAVCNGDDLPAEEILDHLSGLVNKSMLICETPVDSGPENTIPAENRYRLLETFRQYAQEKLFDAGESSVWRNRHLAYYLAKAEAAEIQLRSAQLLECTRYLNAELENIRAAVDWSYSDQAETLSGLRIAAAISRKFMQPMDLYGEGVDWLLTGLHSQPGIEVPPLLLARALNGLGGLGLNYSDYLKTRAWFAQSIQICRQLAASPEAQAELSYALWGLARCIQISLGDLNDVETMLEESVAIAHRLPLDLIWYRGQALQFAALLYWIALGQPGKALQYAEEGRQAGQQSGDRWTVIGLWVLGSLAAEGGNDQQAQVIFEDALRRFDEAGDRNASANTHVYLGRLYRKKGKIEQALFHDMEFLRRWHEMHSQFRVNDGFLYIGLDRASQASSLSGSARAAGYHQAAVLFGAATRLRSEYRAFILTREESDYQLVLGAIKSELGEPDFQAAWEEGLALTQEQAYALAME